MILLEKDLDVVADGVTEGRRIFANTMKYVLMGTSSNFGNMFSAAGASLFLTFLPMLPSQILLNNLLYDASQLAIPTDQVDESQLHRPSHWDIRFIRRFMIFFGPLSSVFDFVTFGVMLWVFHSGPDAVPNRLVRRVTGHPDPGDLRHPNPTNPLLPQPSQPAGGAGRCSVQRWSVPCCRPLRWLTRSASAPLAGAFFAALVGDDHRVSRADRDRQAGLLPALRGPCQTRDARGSTGIDTCADAPPTSAGRPETSGEEWVARRRSAAGQQLEHLTQGPPGSASTRAVAGAHGPRTGSAGPPWI